MNLCLDSDLEFIRDLEIPYKLVLGCDVTSPDIRVENMSAHLQIPIYEELS